MNCDESGRPRANFCDIRPSGCRSFDERHGEKLMKRSTKMALTTGALAVAGGLFLTGAGLADSDFGRHGPHMGMMGIGSELLQGVDTNGDGALSQDEIDAAVNGRFGGFDADKDAKLSLDEFRALWAEITRPVAVRAFQFLDPNGDAAIEKQELSERFGTAVARWDRNDDGVLSQADRPHGRFGRHGGRERDGDSDE
jgi:hypothetical protein